MKQHDIDTIFKNLSGDFDLEETPEGHQHRFLDKLAANNSISKEIDMEGIATSSNSMWKTILSIAAVLAIILTIGSTYNNEDPSTADLASISPEMEQTQNFFTTTINQELETLRSYDSPKAKSLINDALTQMELLEIQYDGLKKDLVDSGNDKRVIYAMISNFQNRIELLEQVIIKIEEIRTLNTNQNETIL